MNQQLLVVKKMLKAKRLELTINQVYLFAIEKAHYLN
jgi:hypothetical protein